LISYKRSFHLSLIVKITDRYYLSMNPGQTAIELGSSLLE
jgi:hypothetical protein